MKRLHVLVVAASCDASDVGEAFVGYQWVRNIARRARVTLLTQQRVGRAAVAEQLPGVEVVAFPEPAFPAALERFNAMAKPAYTLFRRRAERWIAQALAAGRHFDVAQQVTPLALRCVSPLARFDIPWVMGPLGGSLDTPETFVAECGSAALFTRLRGLDRLRIALDPMLRRSWRRADLVLGVAPYVGELLAEVGLQRFEVMSELGIEDLAPVRRRPSRRGALKLVHVGRAVRTKGLRDAIRALALLPEDLDVALDVAGDGEERPLCEALARELGVAHRVRFHGRIDRDRVEALYAEADAFLFPSFREPSGSVVFEAMRHGLPVITADRGGPGHVVDEHSGIRVAVTEPERFAADLADAIRALAASPERVARLSEGARSRMADVGLWDRKLDRLMAFYEALATRDAAMPADHATPKPI